MSIPGPAGRHALEYRAPNARKEGNAMRYMLLIYTDESTDLSPGDPGFDEMMAGYGRFSQAVRGLGVYEAGDPLQSVATATSVRVRNGKTSHTDGPFAETREQLGGYYILDCKDLDQALELAAEIPGAARGTVEVRPITNLG
jgi:hypothetical protein